MSKPTTDKSSPPDQISTKYDALISELLRMKEDVRDNVSYRIKETETYKKIQAIPQNELALHINEYDPDSPGHLLVSCRLSGDDPLERDLSKCVELLYDVEFNMESYMNIGYNDGLAGAISTLLKTVGLDEDADKAMEAIYKFD
jgi:hypothetical protein